MTLQQAFDSSLNVIEDRRAAKRDVGQPTEIVTESTYRLGDRAKQIDALLTADPVPVAFVDASGNVWVLTAGGSGVVVFESADSQPADDYQNEVVNLVVAGLRKRFNVKTKKAKKAEPDVVVGVVEPEFPTDWPDTISDVESEEVD